MGGLGVVPRLLGLVGCLWWGHVIVLFLRGVSRRRGPTSSRCGRVFLVLNALGFGVGFVDLLSQFLKFIYTSELESRGHTHLKGEVEPLKHATPPCESTS